VISSMVCGGNGVAQNYSLVVRTTSVNAII
jgi:hypothetical protein